MEYAMYMKGGSLGEIHNLEIDAKKQGIKNWKIGKYRFYQKLNEDLESAQAKIKRYNKYRSAGERSYYKIHYKLFPLKDKNDKKI